MDNFRKLEYTIKNRINYMNFGKKHHITIEKEINKKFKIFSVYGGSHEIFS